MKTNHHNFFSICLVRKTSKQGTVFVETMFFEGVEAVEMMYCFCILKVYNAFRTSLAECLSTQSDISVSEIVLQLEQLQKELISKDRFLFMKTDYPLNSRQVIVWTLCSETEKYYFVTLS